MVVFSSILGLGSPQQPVFVLGSTLSRRPLEIPMINGLCHAVSGAKLIPRQRPLLYLLKDGGDSRVDLRRMRGTSVIYFSIKCKWTFGKWRLPDEGVDFQLRGKMLTPSSACSWFFIDFFFALLSGFPGNRLHFEGTFDANLNTADPPPPLLVQ